MSRPGQGVAAVACGVLLVTASMGARACWAQGPGDGKPVVRTRTQVEALIKKVGSEAPSWWEEVELTYPRTLDMDWPLKPVGDWDAQRNVGQYIWDVINPNPGKWREGIRLVHHLMIRHQKDPAKLARSMQTLGAMFHNLLEDWARAAFWWRTSQRYGGQVDVIQLAHCYWKLGCREMAAEVLAKVRYDYTRHGALIKLWADMGDIDRALDLARGKAASGMPTIAYLSAGDACRLAGRYAEALAYYEKVLAVKSATGREGDAEKARERAAASIQAITLFDTLDVARVAEGTYTAESIAYAGPLRVEVTVKAGRIESVRVIEHREKQFYSALAETPRQIVARQGVKGVDAVTGATMTSEAIINATARALAGGMRRSGP